MRKRSPGVQFVWLILEEEKALTFRPFNAPRAGGKIKPLAVCVCRNKP